MDPQTSGAVVAPPPATAPAPGTATAPAPATPRPPSPTALAPAPTTLPLAAALPSPLVAPTQTSPLPPALPVAPAATALTAATSARMPAPTSSPGPHAPTRLAAPTGVPPPGFQFSQGLFIAIVCVIAVLGAAIVLVFLRMVLLQKRKEDDGAISPLPPGPPAEERRPRDHRRRRGRDGMKPVGAWRMKAFWRTSPPPSPSFLTADPTDEVIRIDDDGILAVPSQSDRYVANAADIASTDASLQHARHLAPGPPWSVASYASTSSTLPWKRLEAKRTADDGPPSAASARGLASGHAASCTSSSSSSSTSSSSTCTTDSQPCSQSAASNATSASPTSSGGSAPSRNPSFLSHGISIMARVVGYNEAITVVGPQRAVDRAMSVTTMPAAMAVDVADATADAEAEAAITDAAAGRGRFYDAPQARRKPGGFWARLRGRMNPPAAPSAAGMTLPTHQDHSLSRAAGSPQDPRGGGGRSPVISQLFPGQSEFGDGRLICANETMVRYGWPSPGDLGDPGAVAAYAGAASPGVGFRTTGSGPSGRMRGPGDGDGPLEDMTLEAIARSLSSTHSVSSMVSSCGPPSPEDADAAQPLSDASRTLAPARQRSADRSHISLEDGYFEESRNPDDSRDRSHEARLSRGTPSVSGSVALSALPRLASASAAGPPLPPMPPNEALPIQGHPMPLRVLSQPGVMRYHPPPQEFGPSGTHADGSASFFAAQASPLHQASGSVIANNQKPLHPRIHSLLLDDI
ncbi:hypothetical protein CXG81DRAFT_23382 [Caulochytrium protostelioides]|uniref:Uncharacterized protein n=1 Tax=Caulochytrium protostelioides TaxID=1555241 RepID=A0A4V1IVG4_9FUNG|nr:hypothetical protein CXG81DRAFT_23382 [Caulochytrium protostelioides]|eukprot:RKP03969.1 hypothetical protein CXG81DRAFT_23382 [Caulochytrium protostelioides]